MKPFSKLRALHYFSIVAFQFFSISPLAAILDTNENGMSDLWEKQHNNGSLFPSSFLPTADPDQDGWDNATEAVAGTSPFHAQIDSGKVDLQIQQTTVIGTFTLEWRTKAGKNYQIQTSSDLQDWADLDNPLQSGNANLTVAVSALNAENQQPAKLFWRVVISDRDVDGDGLADHEEMQIGSSPASADTDNDGKFDMEEVLAGTSTTEANSGDDTESSDPDTPIVTQVNNFFFTTEVITVIGNYSYDKKEEVGLLENENSTEIYDINTEGVEGAHEITMEDDPFALADLQEKMLQLDFPEATPNTENQGTSATPSVVSNWSAAIYKLIEDNELVSETQHVNAVVRKARCLMHVPPRPFEQTYKILKIKHTISNAYENFENPPNENKEFTVIEVTVDANESTAEIILGPEAECPMMEGGQYEIVIESLHVLAAAVDMNRDGNISFAGDDQTTATEPLRFWVNDDKDIGHTVDGSDWEEDDVPDKTAEDRSTAVIDCKRDLEDFLLFKINVASLTGLIGDDDDELQMKIRINGTGANTPSIRLYPSLWNDIRYLTDESDAQAQIAGVYGNSVMSVNSTAQMISSDIWSHANSTSSTLNGEHNLRMLLEGEAVGEGEIIVELHYDGEMIAEFNPIHIDLRKAEDLYQTWSCGEVTAAGVDYSSATWPAAAVTKIKGATAPAPATEEQKDLIVFVHGWNMLPTDKPDFANTMYKRLWHAGYKGCFASFQWPTFWYSEQHGGNIPVTNYPNPHNFNGSELRAWNSAPALKELIKTLAPQYSVGGKSKIKLYAHSMGNIVAGEALRLLKDEGLNNHVSHYVAAQAAISAHAYDNTTANQGLNMKENPNIYGHYWQPGVTSAPHRWRAEGRPSYFSPMEMPSGTKFFLHHNSGDYALNKWKINNTLKPSSNYIYLDQRAVASFVRYNSTISFNYTKLGIFSDRYEIFSWAAQADSLALGAEPATGGKFKPADKLKLNDSPFNFDSSAKCHSAQFRSFIQKRWDYWLRTIEQLEITTSIRTP